MIGMLPRQQDVIRPLLEISHAETLAYCERHSIVPLEDASNADPRFPRNRIRHELLPLLESLNPGIRETLLRNAAGMRVDFEWIETQVDAFWPGIVIAEQEDAIRLKLQTLLALPLALQRHLLRRVTARLYAGQSPLELRHYALIEELLRKQHDRKERTLHLPHQLRATSRFNEVVFERLHEYTTTDAVLDWKQESEEVVLPIPGQIEVPGTLWMAMAETLAGELAEAARRALRREDWPEVWRLLPSTRHSVYVDGDIVGSFVCVRTRRPGDHIRPLGMTHEKKVQDVLVDKYIPRAERAHIPLFFSVSSAPYITPDGGLHRPPDAAAVDAQRRWSDGLVRSVWLAGVCLDDRVRLTSRTHHIVRLSIEADRQ